MTVNPYSPPQADLSEKAVIVPGKLASRSRRLAAAMISLVLYGLTLPVAVEIAYRMGSSLSDLRATLAAFIGIMLLPIGLQLHSMRKTGQSLVKGWFGLRVMRSDGSNVGLLRYALLREAIPLLVILLFPIGVVLLALSGWLTGWLRHSNMLFGGLACYALDSAFIFRPDRRCLHDLLCDTVVIRVDDHHA